MNVTVNGNHWLPHGGGTGSETSVGRRLIYYVSNPGYIVYIIRFYGLYELFTGLYEK